MTASERHGATAPRAGTLDVGRVAAACGIASLVLLGALFADLARWVVVDGQTGGVEDALFEPERSSPLLIFGVFGLLMWGRRRRIRDAIARGRGLPVVGLPVFALAIGLVAWARHVGEPAIAVYGFALALIGVAAILAGGAGVRYVLFPACFTLLAIPLPGLIVNAIVYPLQVATAHGACAVLETIGVDTTLLGVRFHALDRSFQVIESCAGLRSMLTALMASLVYVEVMVPDRRRGWLLVPAGVAIALATNILRVVTIVLIPDQELTEDHSIQGIVAIVVTVLLLAGLDRLSSKALGRPRPPAARATAARPQASSDAPRFVALLCASALGAAAVWLTPVWAGPPARSGSLVAIPYAFSGWNATNLKVDREFLGSVDFDERVYRRYAQDDVEVDLFVAVDRRLDPHHSVLSAKTALLGGAVGVGARSAAPAAPGRPAAEELQLLTPAGRIVVWTWVEGRAGFGAEAVRSLLALDRGATRREGAVVVYRVATPLDGSLDSARLRLDRFLEAALPELELAPGIARAAGAGASAPHGPGRPRGA